jgi:cell division protein FtsI/penicillin-binding protein 2
MQSNLRENLILLIFLIWAFLIGGRLYFIQVLGSQDFQVAAGDRQIAQTIAPKRGEIFMQDRDGGLTPLAINKKWVSVYAVPRLIGKDQAPELALRLARILGLDQEVVLRRLSKPNDPYEPLKDRLSEAEIKTLGEIDEPGIRTSSQWGRFYPLKEVSAPVIGFLGFRNNVRVGQYGLEEWWEKELAGRAGLLRASRDSLGNLVNLPGGLFQVPQDGADLVLGLDSHISLTAQGILEDLVDKWQADSGQILVMDPKTGLFKALVSVPSFDPNYYNEYGAKSFLSPFHQLAFEPGSVFKPITFAAALDSKALTPQDTFEDPGEVKIGPETIRNSDGKAHGRVNMTQVLEQSLNTGAIFALETMGPDTFKNYLKEFRFGVKTGLDLAGEVSGDIANLDTGRPINFATASFGQGISLTSVQLIRALAAVANGGSLLKPRIVEKIIDSKDRELQAFGPQILGKVISQDTSARLTAMLVSVVENGFGRKAGVPGYWVAGKTGTAQIPDPERGGYLPDKVIHTFVGYAPAYDPAFIALIKLDGPKGVRFASDSVAPAFRKLATFILNYYEIPPEREE